MFEDDDLRDRSAGTAGDEAAGCPSDGLSWSAAWRSDGEGVEGVLSSGSAGQSAPLGGGLDDPLPSGAGGAGGAGAGDEAEWDELVARGGLGGLSAAVEALCGVEVDALCEGELAAALVALLALSARIEWALCARLAAFDAGRGWALGGHRSVASWWAAHSVLPKESAATAVRCEKALGCSATVAAALAAGAVSVDQARLLGEYASRKPELFEPQAAMFCGLAAWMSRRDLRQVLEVWADVACPSDAPRKEAERWASRRLDARTGVDGRVHGGFALDADDGVLFWQVLAHFEDLVRVTAGPGDDRTPAQLRADAFGAALLALRDGLPTEDPSTATTGHDGDVDHDHDHDGDHDHGHDDDDHDGESHAGERASRTDPAAEGPRVRRGRRPDVSVIVPLELLGADGVGLAHISGLPLAITGDFARYLSCDCDATAALFDGASPLCAGRSIRTCPEWLRRVLARRDGGCAFPGCGLQPRFCDAHHLWHWEAGGPTDIDNLVLLCRYHHRLVHHGAWKTWLGLDGLPRFRRLDAGERPHRHDHQRRHCCDTHRDGNECGHRWWGPDPAHHHRIAVTDHLTRPPGRPPDFAARAGP